MFRKNLTIAGIALLAVPAALYMNGHWQEDLTDLINRQTEQSPTAAGAPLHKWKAGQILVKPKAGVSDDEFDKILKGNKAARKGKIGSLPVHVVKVPSRSEEAVVRALSKHRLVEFAELDMQVELSATSVNDPQFASAWHLSKMQTPTAWDYAKGQGVTIAILDTGVDSSHPDLAPQLVAGINAVDGSTATNDIFGHGTEVAGTAAAVSNNATGVASVAWLSKIMPIRVSNDISSGNAFSSDIATGLTWAADNGADVANISYNITASATVTSAAQYMRSKGGVVVGSAGNDGIDLGYTDNPYIITVSATNSTDAKASWSSYGNYVDVSAPGASILTTTKGGGYGSVSGTSFSSPATAGVVALIMSANPNLGPADIEKVLENSAVKVAGTDFHPYYGYGRVDAAAAVQLALNTVAQDATMPSVNIFAPTAGSIVSGVVTVDVNASDNVGVNQVSLYANGKLLGTDTIAPYQFSWNSASVADGSATLSATASDDAGNQATSANLTLSVKNQSQTVSDSADPTVTISKPTNGTKISGVVGIAVTAKDDVAVAKVVLTIDGKQVGTTTGSSLNYNWNAKKAAAGSHSIQAIATDTANKTATMTIQVTK